MGITKQYLRWVPDAMMGVISSSPVPPVFVSPANKKAHHGRYIAAAACEHVYIWDLKKQEKILTFQGEKESVCLLKSSPCKTKLAIAYTDGTLTINDVTSGELLVTFKGHKSAISSLSYDRDGARLASGGKDTAVIVWDVIAECGLVRLNACKAPVTGLTFMSTRQVLIAVSKDSVIRFWDLGSQHCFKSLVCPNTEISGVALSADDSLLIISGRDNQIHVWHVTETKELEDVKLEQPEKSARIEQDKETESDKTVDEMIVDRWLSCRELNPILRRGRGRTRQLLTDDTNNVLACVGTDKQVEMFQLRSELQATDHLKQLTKGKKKRKQTDGLLTLADFVHRLPPVTASDKVKAFAVSLLPTGEYQVCCSLASNALELYGHKSKKSSNEDDVAGAVMSVHRPGVSAAARSVQFSSDAHSVLSVGGSCLKLWNRETCQCTRTLRVSHALCASFVPGDRHVVVGCQDGSLQIVDLGSSTVQETIAAHEESVWSLDPDPNKKFIISGSEDKTVKFWDYELVASEEGQARNQLALIHTRTLKVGEGVLSVRISPDTRFILASLLDFTVKTFFMDTLKLQHSLYGHSAPVLSLDVSSDSNTAITASGDKSIKVWGLDWGDCHRSLLAHDDSVMFVRFLPQSRLFFSAGKDGKIKQWDSASFELIFTLHGHQAAVWSLAVSPSAKILASVSQDFSVRLWEKTDEIIVLSEEQQVEREKESDEALASGHQPVVAGESSNAETGVANRSTLASVTSAERIMESLKIYLDEEEKRNATGEYTPHPILQSYNTDDPAAFMEQILLGVKASELEMTMLMLPLSDVSRVLHVLTVLLRRPTIHVENLLNIAQLLVRLHLVAITSSLSLRPVIEQLAVLVNTHSRQLADSIGFQRAGLKTVQSHIEAKHEERLFSEQVKTKRLARRKKKIVYTLR